MIDPPPSQRETQELISRFQVARARKRRLRLAVAGIAATILVVGIITAAVIASPSSGSPSADRFAMADEVSAASLLGESDTTGPSSPLPNCTSVGPTTGDADTTAATGRRMTTTTELMTVTTTSPVTTTVRPASTTVVSSVTAISPTAEGAVRGTKVVVIDPGHQAQGDSGLEPIGPGSSDRKAKVTDGTSGVATGIAESELVLSVSLKLRDSLTDHGITVLMTRTSENVNISNIERAQIANHAQADLFVRIHADGSDNPSTAGVHVLYPAVVEGWTDDIASASQKAASLAQRELIAATGAIDRGTDARTDMTGFNWSDVPVILPEIGFMTNPSEDRLLATAAYQDKIVKGLTRAILVFLDVS